MSDYEYKNSPSTMHIRPSTGPETTFLWVHEGRKEAAILIPNADAPMVAAELLKAAGRSELAELIEAVEADRTARVEREAAAKKLQERRTAVLAALLPEAAAANNLPHPHELSTLDDRAIDRIIELEDGK